MYGDGRMFGPFGFAMIREVLRALHPVEHVEDESGPDAEQEACQPRSTRRLTGPAPDRWQHGSALENMSSGEK